MERFPLIKHRKMGTVSMINNGSDFHGSQFLITLSDNIDYLDGKHTVFGHVAKGFEVLEKLNEWICDKDGRPYQDIRIMHTVILDDPFEDFAALSNLNGRASPEPSDERIQSDRIRIDEEVDQLEGMSAEEIEKFMKQREANTRAKLLEIIGDIPDADIKPPENVLFVCKLNPVTTDEDLELIFSRFGKINSCEVIRDKKTGDSLCYAFIEFDRQEDCENAYFKMDNVLIDDRRIHVDFSQSVAKVKWKGKGTGTGYFEDNKNFRDEMKREDSKQKFKFTDKSRRGHGYELIFDEESRESGKYEPVTERDHRHRRYEPSKTRYGDKKSEKREKSRERHHSRDRKRSRDRNRSREKYNEKESKKNKYKDSHKYHESDYRRNRDRDGKSYDRRK